MITVEELKPRIRESRTNGTVLDLIQLANAQSVPMGEMFSLYSQATAEVNAEAQPAEQMKSENGEGQGIQIESDPFDFTEPDKAEFQTGSVELKTSLKQFAESAANRGFHIFGLTPKDKVTIPGSHGFKDSKPPSDATVLSPWNEVPDRNIGIDCGASDLCVLDFDKPEDVPDWLNEIETYKIKTSRGIHIYFRGARPGKNMYVNGKHVGEIKSIGGYVLSEGSVHPSGSVYTVVDDSAILSIPERVTELFKDEDKTPVHAGVDGPPIPYGSHDIELTRISGVLRNAGMSALKIEEHLIEVCEKRCEGYGSADYKQMCRKIAHSIGKKPVGEASPIPLIGGVPVGQGSVVSSASQTSTDWRSNFKTVGELEQGDVRMLIDGVLPEGTAFIGGLPGEGKTLFALSIARALTTGKPFLQAFNVSKIVPVIYLIPESGGRAFRKRCERFQIPNDPDLFLCRTVSEGSTLPLDDASLFEAIRRLKPVVILDTIIRFSEAQDENQAMQNKALVDDVIRLRQNGAVAVIGLHHATKAMREKGMSLETVLRGTGDIAASADAVYGLLRDSMLYNNGMGPNEIDVACLKPRDFEPPHPFRIAATARPTNPSGNAVVGMESIIDVNHDFRIVSKSASEQATGDVLERLVKEDPAITLDELAKITGQSTWGIRKALKQRHWVKSRGGAKGASRWSVSPVNGFEGAGQSVKGGPDADISFDSAGKSQAVN